MEAWFGDELESDHWLGRRRHSVQGRDPPPPRACRWVAGRPQFSTPAEGLGNFTGALAVLLLVWWVQERTFRVASSLRPSQVSAR